MDRLRLEDQRPDGYRHFIGAEPIHCGDTIEALIGDKWLRGRYEASIGPNSSDPSAYFHYGDDRVLHIPEGTPVRWK